MLSSGPRILRAGPSPRDRGPLDSAPASEERIEAGRAELDVAGVRVTEIELQVGENPRAARGLTRRVPRTACAACVRSARAFLARTLRAVQ